MKYYKLILFLKKIKKTTCLNFKTKIFSNPYFMSCFLKVFSFSINWALSSTSKYLVLYISWVLLLSGVWHWLIQIIHNFFDKILLITINNSQRAEFIYTWKLISGGSQLRRTLCHSLRKHLKTIEQKLFLKLIYNLFIKKWNWFNLQKSKFID